MPRTKENQKFYKVPKPNQKYKWQLVVTRMYGNSFGKTYKRTFATEREMNLYIERNSDTDEVPVAAYKDWDYNLTAPRDKNLKDKLLQGAKNRLGLKDLSEDEKWFLRGFYEEEGRYPHIWENPFMLDRAGDLIDTAFTASAIYGGPALARQLTKGLFKGASLALEKKLAKMTKDQIKKYVKSAAKELIKKDTVKNTLKKGAKYSWTGAKGAMNLEYKTWIVGEYSNLVKNAVDTIKK